jgi:bifunctional UDP-N-acetylglucosamine pyrophosphorylase/glucosamine-1-phosphate N-acetyltransferase
LWCRSHSWALRTLLTTEPALKGASGTLVLLSGDVPLLAANTLKTLVERHQTAGAAATVVTAVVDDPTGYGRIVRSGEKIARIVEHRDATDQERTIQEINSGIYAFDVHGLFDALRNIAAENAQREYYLPDVIALYRKQGRGVETQVVADVDEIRGINSRVELAAVGRIVRQNKNAELMAAGVTIEDPATTYVDPGVTIGADTILHPGVSIEGNTTIGGGCEIHSGVESSTRLADRVTEQSLRGHGVGPSDGLERRTFAHLRGGAVVSENARRQLRRAQEDDARSGSKAMHSPTSATREIGAKVNIGAGTITCNYDGEKKIRRRSRTAPSSAATRSWWRR